MEYIYKNDLGEIVGKSNCHMEIEGATEYEATEEDIVKYDDKQKITDLRIRREEECFTIYNRNYPKGYFTEEQQQELDEWYLAWLDVTDTLIVPERPKWLSNK